MTIPDGRQTVRFVPTGRDFRPGIQGATRRWIGYTVRTSLATFSPVQAPAGEMVS